MRTIRRLYFYAVTLVSLEIVLWGLIGLVRSAFSTHVVGGGAARLAQALALILVGVPVFGLHWWLAQRAARADMDEHALGVRSFFLYAVLLGTLIPIAQNGLALSNRLLLQVFRLPMNVMFGGGQSWSDNLIAMLMNALVAAYFIMVLRADWREVTPKDTLIHLRRVYRYIWVIYSLVMLVAGVQQSLQYTLEIPAITFGYGHQASFVNGLSLLLLGAPLWFFAWKTVQDALAEAAERESALRLGVLYFLSLAGVIAVLASGGIVLAVLLRLLLGERIGLSDFMRQVSGPLSLGIPLAGVWAYYGRWLGRTMAEAPDAPRRAGMRSLYFYILSALGLGATFIGLYMLLSFTIDASLGDALWANVQLARLAASLATLCAGLPLWLLTWRPMQAEALAPGDTGDHARRSLVRKIYLYLALFASVIGGMIVAVTLLFVLIRAMLGDQPTGFTQSLLNSLQLLFLFAGMGFYHGLILRRDGRMAAHALSAKHALFPVLIFGPGGEDAFAATMLAALQKAMPHLSAAIQPVGQPMAEDALATVKAVLVPGELALDPPEALRLWLRDFNGSRLIVPRGAPGWIWTGGVWRPLQAAAGQAAQAVRQLAEGQEVRQQGGTSGWMTFVYILASLAGLELLMVLVSLVVSLFQG
jgi:preprotein translocase subunit YajC